MPIKQRMNLFFARHMNPTRILLLLTFGLLAVFVGIGIYNDKPSNHQPDHLSAAEHLKRAREACGLANDEYDSKCLNPSDAYIELWAIPQSAPEYPAASKLLAAIQQQARGEEGTAAQTVTGSEGQNAEAAQTREQAFEKMQRNVSGQAHDGFTCATSTEDKPIMSFDNGQSWWLDDGRCAAQLEAKREAEQKVRDEDAKIYSYWPTTLRVDTDMDSFWLPDEERTCQTYPDSNGKVAIVGCNPTGSHKDHNIPVKFWGGVERNTVSNWKCRREGDQFVCRAID
ncbi:MAG: hypothetical protein ABSG84_12595 [Acidobacteriaceae bacterium]|jgi:hypothetical protein